MSVILLLALARVSASLERLSNLKPIAAPERGKEISTFFRTWNCFLQEAKSNVIFNLGTKELYSLCHKFYCSYYFYNIQNKILFS